MKVTPVKKKFGSHKPGDVFELPDRTAKILVKLGKLAFAPSVLAAPATMNIGPVPSSARAEDLGVPEEAITNLVEESASDEAKAPEPYETRMLTADKPSAPAKRTYTRRTQPGGK